jgi:dihydrofolate reductase
VSATLEKATWRNSRIVGPYDPTTLRNLKAGVDGHIYVSGSVTLVRGMLADGLVDALHLFVYPVTLGAGPRLFAEGDEPAKLTLDTCEHYANGVVGLTYRPRTG